MPRKIVYNMCPLINIHYTKAYSENNANPGGDTHRHIPTYMYARATIPPILRYALMFNIYK